MFAAWWGGDGKTFKPRRGHRPGSRQFQLHQRAELTLGSGNLREAVALPDGEDLDEWLAMKSVDLFNEVELVYGTVSDYCTEASCPRMCAGRKWEYKWADGKVITRPIEVSAPRYVELLLSWVSEQLDDPQLFPTTPGVPFPASFRPAVKNIFRRLFRVYAHLYHHHHERIIELTFEAHLNSCFKHLFFFIQEFDLASAQDLEPLQPLIDKLVEEDDKKWGRPPRGAG